MPFATRALLLSVNVMAIQRAKLPPIDSFRGKYFYLSNFYPAVVWDRLDDAYVAFPTLEHAFAAAKTHNLLAKECIWRAPTPGAAKGLGRRVQLRPDWENVKIGVMELLVYKKFNSHPHLRNSLIGTGRRELIEGNWWGDRFWGVCRGEGQNELGKILMRVRTKLQEEKQS